jgi:hypothetical protein
MAGSNAELSAAAGIVGMEQSAVMLLQVPDVLSCGRIQTKQRSRVESSGQEGLGQSV